MITTSSTGDGPRNPGRDPDNARVPPTAELAAIARSGRDGGVAACRLGDRYRQGIDGVRHSPRLARHWYARSALAGDPNGQNNLGACFEHGLGAAQSYPRAVHWYRQAAAQGLGIAASNVAYCYLRGQGVGKSLEHALAWFQRGVELGDGRDETRELVSYLRRALD
jgi:TPR repeat protein